MKREILFRGQVKYNGNHLFTWDWVCGSLIVKTGRTFIHVIEEDSLGNIVREFDVEVIPETIGQFTGLTDKNGLKIFEGDIIKYTEHSRYLLKSFIAAVSYKEYLASFAYLKLGLDENGWEQPLIHFFNEIDEFEEDMLPYIEIIGNIYDNPELLK